MEENYSFPADHSRRSSTIRSSLLVANLKNRLIYDNSLKETLNPIFGLMLPAPVTPSSIMWKNQRYTKFQQQIVKPKSNSVSNNVSLIKSPPRIKEIAIFQNEEDKIKINGLKPHRLRHSKSMGSLMDLEKKTREPDPKRRAQKLKQEEQVSPKPKLPQHQSLAAPPPLHSSSSTIISPSEVSLSKRKSRGFSFLSFMKSEKKTKAKEQTITKEKEENKRGKKRSTLDRLRDNYKTKKEKTERGKSFTSIPSPGVEVTKLAPFTGSSSSSLQPTSLDDKKLNSTSKVSAFSTPEKSSKSFVVLDSSQNPGFSFADYQEQQKNSLLSRMYVSPSHKPQHPIPLHLRKYKSKDILLTSLSIELILKIFSYLDTESLLNASETCKDWNSIIESAPIWGNNLSLADYLAKLYNEEQRSFQESIQNSPAFENERTRSLIKMLGYLQKLGKREDYFSKLKKLEDLHESHKNFVEAGLAVLQSAQEYDWNDKKKAELIQKRKSASKSKKLEISKEPESITRERLYHRAIEYFGKGKYWELGISLLQELRHINQYEIHSKTEQLQSEREYYLNIRKQDRFFEQYFMVEFYGSSFDAFYRNKKFIYRGQEAEKLSQFIERMKARFGEIEILNQDPTEEQKKEEKKCLRIRTVSPSSFEESCGTKRVFPVDMPSAIKMFYRNTNVNVFTFSNPFRKTNAPSQNEIREYWIRSTYVFTKDVFPTLCRYSPVVSTKIVEHSPIENAIRSMSEKNETLKQKIDKVEITQTWNQNFTMAIKGVIDPAVNGGIEKYKEAFFSEAFKIEASEEEKNLLPEFTRTLKEQITILERALRLHKKLVPENMEKLHSSLIAQFESMKQKNQFAGVETAPSLGLNLSIVQNSTLSASQEPEDKPDSSPNSSSLNSLNSSSLNSNLFPTFDSTPPSSLSPSPTFKNNSLDQLNSVST